jgi:hypothetical protein
MTQCNLQIEAVLGANHVTKGAEGHSASGCDVEYRERVVDAEEEALVNLRIAVKV